MNLNPQQLAASNFTNGVCSVVAVPGSGKTLTMTHRIANLVNSGVAPQSILGVTFTRNAAAAMRTKLAAILYGSAGKVNLSTIHGFCYQLLKNEGRIFELLHGVEQLKFLRNIMKSQKIRVLPPGLILREISLSKNNNISAEEFSQIYVGDSLMEQIGKVFLAYEKEKRMNHLLDFNDLLTESMNLMKKNSEVREKYRQTYRHILVDEFQDTNPIQIELLKMLMCNGKDSSFYVTGDDWQAIYSFMGASVTNLLNFGSTYKGSKQFVLDTNYRSTPEILEACSNLINHNQKKIDKDLNTSNPNGQKVMVIEAANPDDEALRIAYEIQGLVSSEHKHIDIAVLYRANSQSRSLEDVFNREKIPYHIENGVTFYERREVRILLDYLRLINNPMSIDGDDGLKSVINSPNRYIGKKFMGELENFAHDKDISYLYDALKRQPVVVPYLKRNINDFTKLIDSMTGIKDQRTPAEMLSMLRVSLNYDEWISEDDIQSPDNNIVNNLEELQIAASKYKDIPSLLNFTDSFKDVDRNNKEGVALMTIHKAKGLEFPVVFTIGFVDGVLPNCMGDIEEERRIAFVGISRAMKLLYLSYSTNYLGKAATISPFLKEILGK